MLYLFAAMYGFSHGGFFTVHSPLLADLFGLSSHGAILGLVMFVSTIAGAAGPFSAGLIFDIFGSYHIATLVCAILNATGIGLTVLIGYVKQPPSAIRV